MVVAEGEVMPPKRTALSIYIPKRKEAQRPVERLKKLAKTQDRSLNWLIIEAILEYLDREKA